MTNSICSTIAAFAIGFWCAGAQAATTLITDAEAQRPNAPQEAIPRDITRGPVIQFEAPSAAIAHKPFDFNLKMQAHGGATIDPAKVHVTLLKVPNVDLTERLRPFVTAKGIDLPDADAAAGEHPLRIDVEDSDGRVGHAIVTLGVEKKTP